jgi:quercetin dioxygenase-like cupin family protein
MEQYRIDFNAMQWEAAAAGIRIKAHEQGGKRLRLVELGKEFVEPDWCTKGHIGYVLEGRLEIDFNGNVISFGPGDGLFVPPSKEHKHKGRALSDVVRLIIVEVA